MFYELHNIMCYYFIKDIKIFAIRIVGGNSIKPVYESQNSKIFSKYYRRILN